MSNTGGITDEHLHRIEWEPGIWDKIHEERARSGTDKALKDVLLAAKKRNMQDQTLRK